MHPAGVEVRGAVTELRPQFLLALELGHRSAGEFPQLAPALCRTGFSQRVGPGAQASQNPIEDLFDDVGPAGDLVV